MTDTKEDAVNNAPKTRRDTLIGLFLVLFSLIGVVATVITVASLLEAKEPTQEQQTVVETQPARATATKTVRYFDYAKIVSVIGSQFSDRETDETGERWANESLSSIVRLEGAPDKMTRITLLQPGKSTAEVINKNLLITHSLIVILMGVDYDDLSVVNWISQQEENNINVSKVVNDVTVSVIRMPVAKTYMWFITFELPSN